MISFKGSRVAETVISGPRSEAFILERSDSDHFIGIHFKPGGAFPFLTVPAGELQNLDVTVESIWGTKIHEILDRLLAAPVLIPSFRFLKHAYSKSSDVRRRHLAVEGALRAIHSGQSLSANELADQASLSQRRFIQLFRNEVGLTPKLFSRVIRFQHVLAALEKIINPDWLEIALTAGYFDQAHFIHDFREFSDLTPSEYMAHRTPHLNHVRMSDSG